MKTTHLLKAIIALCIIGFEAQIYAYSIAPAINIRSVSNIIATSSFLTSKSSYDAVYKEQVVASNIQGNNVILSSGKTATLEAANIKANDNIIVDAKSNINVVAKEYGEGEIHETKKSSMGGLSKSMSLKSKRGQATL